MLPGNLGEGSGFPAGMTERKASVQQPIQWSFPFGFAQGQDDEIFGGAGEEQQQVQQQLQQQVPIQGSFASLRMTGIGGGLAEDGGVVGY